MSNSKMFDLNGIELKSHEVNVFSEAIGFFSYIFKEGSSYYYNIKQIDNRLCLLSPSTSGIKIRKKDFKNINKIAETIFTGTHKENDYKKSDYINNLSKLRNTFLSILKDNNYIKGEWCGVWVIEKDLVI